MAGRGSLLGADLAPSVDLLKLGAASGGGGVDVRLAHAFDEGEHATLSSPVDVDLQAAFGPLPFSRAAETGGEMKKATPSRCHHTQRDARISSAAPRLSPCSFSAPPLAPPNM